MNSDEYSQNMNCIFCKDSQKNRSYFCQTYQKRLQEFYDNNKILNLRNPGFKKGDIAVYGLLELTHDIYQGMEDRHKQSI